MEQLDPTSLSGSQSGEMAALVRAEDWSASPLGAPDSWSPALRTVVSLVLANRFPQLLWWGPDYISIYNDAYRPVLGTKHPWALGKPFREVWPEVADILGPMIDMPFHGGPSSWTEDIQLEVNRHGFVEETHFAFAYSPVPDPMAPRGIGGVLATVSEITEKVVGERRLAALRDLGARAGDARSAEAACARMADALAAHCYDVSFALIYLLDTENRHARLAGAMGVDGASDIAPERIALGQLGAWPFAESGATPRPLVVDDLERRFTRVPSGPWRDPPRAAVVIPLSVAQHVVGYLVAGTSPRLRLDERYRSFFDLAAAQIAAGIGNARAHEEERRRAEALAEIDRVKTTFFSSVSHEFRTPLTLMLGPIDDALADTDHPLPPPQRERAELAARNGLRLRKLVNTLLDFSRVEAGRMQAVFQPTDLASLTRDLASSFRAACDKAALSLTIDAPPLTEPVFVDREMWEKIVLNLISNAFKFTFEGGIEVRLATAARDAVLTVRDSGVGIAADELPRIFDRFHRAANARGRSHEGTGIGLALVQELVGQHAGRIDVVSRPGEGTTFTVSLPLGTAHLPADRIGPARDGPSTPIGAETFVSEALRWLPDAGAIETARSPASRAAPSLLIADDNADMRDYLRQLLEPSYRVTLVSDGAEALAALRAAKPDILLSDIMMPGVDGHRVLAAVRADPALADLPVVLLSARAGQEATIEGLKAGADDYLVKPFSARELLSRLAANLERARSRRQLRESDERFRALVNATSDVVYHMSPDWTEMRTLQGRGFLADTDAPSVAWIDEYLLPEDQPHILAAIAEAIRARAPFQLEHRVRQADGSIGWTFSRAVPLIDDRGTITGWFGAASDVTERNAAQAELAETEARLRLAVENAEVGFWDVDPVNDVLTWPPRTKAMFGISPDVPVSMADFYSGLHPDDREATSQAYAAATDPERRALYDVEYRTVGKEDGVIRWVAAKGRGLFDARGRCVRVAGTAIDITARKRTELALRELTETLESRIAARTAELEAAHTQLRQVQKLEAMGSLTGGVAHDFNNLLTPIVGALDTLQRRSVGSERERRLIDGAMQAAERAKTLVQRLLAFARRQPLQAISVDVSGLVRGLAELVASTLGPQIEVVLEVPDTMAAAKADPSQLEMALLNLAVNARDAMPSGGTLHITASVANLGRYDIAGLGAGQYIRLAVADTGIGMDEATLARAVEPFFSTKGVGKGTGLGLSMVHGLASQLGGTLRIESTLGRGTTVELWLAATEEAPDGKPTISQTSAATAQATVLLVDDEDTVRLATSDMLQDLGYTVLEADSAESGLAILRNGAHLDLIVTDHIMPRMTGTDLARAAKVLRPELPILIISGYAESDGIERDLPRLAKPFRKDELAASLSAIASM